MPGWYAERWWQRVGGCGGHNGLSGHKRQTGRAILSNVNNKTVQVSFDENTACPTYIKKIAKGTADPRDWVLWFIQQLLFKQSRRFNKLWNLGQTSAWLCLARGEKYKENCLNFDIKQEQYKHRPLIELNREQKSNPRRICVGAAWRRWEGGRVGFGR